MSLHELKKRERAEQRTDERARLRFMASLAEQSARWEECVEFVREVCSLGVELTVAERNLLSTGYKNLVRKRRESRRVLRHIDAQDGSRQFSNVVGAYTGKIEEQLEVICTEVIALVERDLLPHSRDVENRVFYLKLVGDHFRYLSEFQQDEVKLGSTRRALAAYKNAQEIVDGGQLDPANPVSLGLALNYSVFLYEILADHAAAKRLAERSVKRCLQRLDEMESAGSGAGADVDSSRHESEQVVRLLQDNVQLWERSGI